MTETVTSLLRCQDCAFWESRNAQVGVCRASAPTQGKVIDEVAHWPETDALEGCGDGVAHHGNPKQFVRCGGCAFWHQPHPGDGLQPLDRKDHASKWWEQAGHCRRHKPRPSSKPGHRGFWRVVNESDGCTEGKDIAVSL